MLLSEIVPNITVLFIFFGHLQSAMAASGKLKILKIILPASANKAVFRLPMFWVSVPSNCSLRYVGGETRFLHQCC